MSKEQITIPVFIPHQGCPHTCTYCNQWGATARTGIPGPEEIGQIIRRYTASVRGSVCRIELAFFGGSFTGMDRGIQEGYLSAAAEYLEQNIIQGIRLSTRPDCLSEQALELLVKYNVATIEIGCQSFDDRVLSFARRGHTAADIYASAARVKNRGFDLILQLMPGLPFDTRATSIESARAAADLAPSGVRIYPAVILRGTGLERSYAEKSYHPLSLDEAVDLCSDMYAIFNARGIPIIRMGLHPFSEANISEILAGPYHPAFGYLVKSRFRRKEMMERAGMCIPCRNGHARLLIPEKNCEEYIGYKKENIRFLKEHLQVKSISYEVTGDSDFTIMPEPQDK